MENSSQAVSKYFLQIIILVSLIEFLNILSSQLLNYKFSNEVDLVALVRSLIIYAGVIFFLLRKDKLGVMVAYVWALIHAIGDLSMIAYSIKSLGSDVFTFDYIKVIVVVKLITILISLYVIYFSHKSVKMFLQWILFKKA